MIYKVNVSQLFCKIIVATVSSNKLIDSFAVAAKMSHKRDMAYYEQKLKEKKHKTINK